MQIAGMQKFIEIIVEQICKNFQLRVVRYGTTKPQRSLGTAF